ncbi:MAG: dynamin family protein [Methylococcales bacterium]|nr:dynamin family protein [Methylococcales bacterium]
MGNLKFKEQLHEYAQWRGQLASSIEMYREWRRRYGMSDVHSTDTLLNILSGLDNDRITLAFAAEFSRGKTELINSLFFAETGVRLLPSSPGRTTMCPTEIFYDKKAKSSYIRVLDINTRLEDISLVEYKEMPESWKQISLEKKTPAQMQDAFKQLVAVKTVPVAIADKLGLWNEREAAEQGLANATEVEIPCWRHALISFPHPLLEEGLSILDTPGLNALGTEPELTLSMLPNAQAIIFVLAADTGVTKSDLEMWRSHICSARNNKQGLAVVMNKIDSMWDDLAGEAGYENSIKKQISSSSSILKIEERLIFPVSAKQALLAKVKSNAALLERSRLKGLENYLSDDILKQRRKILMSTILKDIGFLINESSNLTDSKLVNATKQLEEFKKVDFENKDMTGKLMSETRDRQKAYASNVENFQASRRVFTVQAKILIESFAKEKIEIIVQETKGEMSKSLTTFGMKKNIRKLFDDLRDLLQDSIDITNETRRLVKAIHKKFHDEYGFKEIEPKLFSIKQYQEELEVIFSEGEAFRSSTKTTMTEQSVVVNKLYSTLIAKAKNILKQAYKDSLTWSNGVLVPLMHQIKDHKKQIESRLQMLKKINESKGSVSENIAHLKLELEPLKQQRKELSFIIKEMQIEAFREKEGVSS